MSFTFFCCFFFQILCFWISPTKLGALGCVSPLEKGADNGLLTADGQTSPYHTLLESEVLERNESSYSNTQQGTPKLTQSIIKRCSCFYAGSGKGCQNKPFKTGRKMYTQCKSRIKDGFGIRFIKIPVANIKLYFCLL